MIPDIVYFSYFSLWGWKDCNAKIRPNETPAQAAWRHAISLPDQAITAPLDVRITRKPEAYSLTGYGASLLALPSTEGCPQ